MRASRRATDRMVVASGQLRPTLVGAIDGAGSRITLSLFRCTDKEIFAALGRAIDRGVEVEVLVTSRSKGKKKLRKLWDRLESIGASVHPYADPVVKYHAKYLVVDDGPAIVSSLNFTPKCFNKTVDAIVVTYDRSVVDGLRQILHADRDGKPLPKGLSPRLIVGPENARRHLTALLQGAKSSIRILDPKLSDPALLTLLNTRRQEGLTVGLYTAKRFDARRSHGKMMLIDDRIAVVGSLALAPLSLDFRREVAIVVEEPSAVAEVARLFESLQASSPSAGDTGNPVTGSAAC